jgi:hypothetical protein
MGQANDAKAPRFFEQDLDPASVRFGSRLCENSHAGLARRKPFSIVSNNKRTALAVTVERRKERKQFCAFSTHSRFYTAWVKSGLRRPQIVMSAMRHITDSARTSCHVRFVPPPDIPERLNADVPDSRPNFYCSDYSSDRGRYQANPHGPNQTIVQ